MLSQIIGLGVDIGLGALAYSLAKSLKANVITNTALLRDVVKITEDHEERITALEKK